MADITMCQDVKCPSATKCYRFTAKPDPKYQSWADFKRKPGEEKCQNFWPNENRIWPKG